MQQSQFTQPVHAATTRGQFTHFRRPSRRCPARDHAQNHQFCTRTEATSTPIRVASADANASDPDAPLHGVDSPYDVIPFGPAPAAPATTRCLWLRHLDKVRLYSVSHHVCYLKCLPTMTRCLWPRHLDKVMLQAALCFRNVQFQLSHSSGAPIGLAAPPRQGNVSGCAFLLVFVLVLLASLTILDAPPAPATTWCIRLRPLDKARHRFVRNIDI